VGRGIARQHDCSVDQRLVHEACLHHWNHHNGERSVRLVDMVHMGEGQRLVLLFGVRGPLVQHLQGLSAAIDCVERLKDQLPCAAR
jgi:hypothetical protein